MTLTKSEQFKACEEELDAIRQRSRLRYDALKSDCHPDKMDGISFEQRLFECGTAFEKELSQHEERWKHLI